MKNILISICLMLISTTGFSQWVIIDTIACNYYLSNYTSFNVRYCNNGTFFKFFTYHSSSPDTPPLMNVSKTVNDGQDWMNLINCQGFPCSSNDLAFPSPDTGFFSENYDGNVYFRRSINGGIAWTDIASPGPTTLFFISAKKGYGMRENIVYRFENDSIFPVDTISSVLYYPRLFLLKIKQDL